MIAVDSSVAVAGFAPWHPRHLDAKAILRSQPVRLVGHAILEVYSVLTRLPSPSRAPARLVAQHLAEQYTEPPLLLAAEELARLPARFAALDIAGGSVYDGLIGATAAAAGATLVSADGRAQRVYRLLDVRLRPL